MKILGENLKVGDVLETRWMGHSSTIKCFHEYHGPFDFVCKVAEFYDGSRMSIDRDRYYECVD